MVCQIKDYNVLKKKLDEMKKAPAAVRGSTLMIRAKVSLDNYDELKKELRTLRKAPAKVIDATMKDFKSRMPGWIAQEVTKTYNVKKADIRKIGTVSAKGNNISEAQIEFEGRVLTPARFSMSPKTPPPDGGYTLKATIFRGRRVTLQKVKGMTKKQRRELGKNFKKRGKRNSPESPYMLQTTGAQDVDKIQYIPFQRRTQPGKMMYKYTTLSMPQMISHDGKTLKPDMAEKVWPKLEKRFNHHMKRFVGE